MSLKRVFLCIAILASMSLPFAKTVYSKPLDANCYQTSCNNQNPSTSGCGDVYNLQINQVTVSWNRYFELNLRFSRICATRWARTVYWGSVPSGGVYTKGTLNFSGGSTSSSWTIYSSSGSVYTNMRWRDAGQACGGGSGVWGCTYWG